VVRWGWRRDESNPLRSPLAPSQLQQQRVNHLRSPRALDRPGLAALLGFASLTLRCLRRPGRVGSARPSVPPGTWPVEGRGSPALPQVARIRASALTTRSRPENSCSAGRFHEQEARERPPVEAASSGGAKLPRANGEAVSVSERAGTRRRSRGEVWGLSLLVWNHHVRTLSETGNRVGLKGAGRSTPPGRSKHRNGGSGATGVRGAARPGRSGERSEPEVVRACSDGSRAAGGFQQDSIITVVAVAVRATRAFRSDSTSRKMN